jgi:hypothetical protein
MKYLILPLFLLSFTAHAELILNLTEKESEFVYKTLNEHTTIINQSKNKDLLVRAYPFYTSGNMRCRKILIGKDNGYLSTTACKSNKEWEIY